VRLPALSGQPIEIRFVPALRDRRGAVHGGAFVRERRISFDAELRRDPAELSRIFVHELFHFAWVRMGNAARRSWEDVVAAEFAAAARGELGWSAEWRRELIRSRDRARRTRRWREYSCESFCDTAAWLFSGLRSHSEFTLEPRFRAARRGWFRAAGLHRGISI
jgi:hypothetical protein